MHAISNRAIELTPGWATTREWLRSRKLRPTRPRLVVGTLALTQLRHFTLAELTTHPEVIVAGISLASLYNILDDFEAAGIVRRIAINGRRIFFDTDTSEHQHIYDEESGGLIDAPGVELQLLSALPADHELCRTDIIVRIRARKYRKVEEG